MYSSLLVHYLHSCSLHQAICPDWKTFLSTEFRKASPEDKLTLFNSLLKGFQEEVDNLTKRAKFAENAFLNIYQKIYEAPDPYPALASISVII